MAKRTLVSLALLFYCLALFVVFDFVYTAATTRDPTRYRIFNPKYHHGLAANFDGYDVWGNASYPFKTNSLGFRDAEVREVSRTPKNRRILLIGDSFTEGLGLPFEETFAGMLYRAGEERKDKIEVLNAGVSSYSPVIYFKKVKALLDDGVVFDEVVVFSDVSDVQDEATSYFCIDDNPKYRAFCNPDDLAPQRSRRSFVARHLRVTDAIGDWIENNVAFLKKDKPAPYELYRIDWMYRNPRATDYLPLGVEEAIARSLQNMDALASLLSNHGISLTIAVYPWPAQLAHNDRENRQIDMWRNFCRERCKSFINLYPAFFREQTPNPDWYRPLYIPRDIHFTKLGNELIFREAGPRILDDAGQN